MFFKIRGVVKNSIEIDAVFTKTIINNDLNVSVLQNIQ